MHNRTVLTKQKNFLNDLSIKHLNQSGGNMWNLNLKKTFHDLKEWDKKWAKRIQNRFDLTDYQMLCLAFGKGFIIGAILL